MELVAYEMDLAEILLVGGYEPMKEWKYSKSEVEELLSVEDLVI